MSTERRKDNKFIVYTDIVGHTKMFGRVGVAFRQMRERHDELFRSAAKQHAPFAIVKGTGDGFYAAMDDVSSAVETALAFRRALATEDWDKLLPPDKRVPENHIKARVGIHSGLVNVVYDDGQPTDFDGQPRSITDKVMSMAVGNQVLATRQVRDQGQVNLTRRDEMEWKKFGEYKLREVADTVEIWGLGEGELGIGPRPPQPPEHRVIVFVTIHDYSTVVEQAGPNFDALKDKWDTTFEAAVNAHAKDTFVKRLPDGSLAAFRNAMDAVRAARDFRRSMKIVMKNEPLQLQPKIALDSGLVTFDYESNRAVDVRDQPVNIAAKVCKTGLSAAWQLILSRPVREDAFQNMTEREEYKWVCIGRKAVPGEPEPVELWDFQDVQSKSETRTVMWVDAKNVHDSLRVLPHIYAAFAKRLDEMIKEVASRRTEEPWILTTEHGYAAAYKDPVEAVQCAMELRDTAMKEQWERFLTGFNRGRRDDNLIRIGLHQGPMRITFEDGQLKEFKGAVVDGVKPVVDAGKNSQILLSRELKETVGTAFPASEVKWRKVEIKPKDPSQGNEAFELRKVKKIPKPVLIGSAAGAVLLILLLVGVLLLRPSVGIDPRLAKNKAVNDILANAKAGGVGLTEIADRFGTLLIQRDDALKADKRSEKERADELEKEAGALKAIADDWKSYNAVQLYAGEKATIEKLTSLDDFKRWAREALPKYARVKNDPRRLVEWSAAIEALRKQVLSGGLVRTEWKDKVDALDVRIQGLGAVQLSSATLEQVTKDSKEIDAQLAEGSDLRKSLETAIAQRKQSQTAEQQAAEKEAEEQANRLAAAGELPVDALTVILRAQKSGIETLRAIGTAADRAKAALVKATPGKKPDERGKVFEPLAAELRGLLDDQQEIDFVALAQDWKADGSLDKLAQVSSIEELSALLKHADDYRPATGDDPRQTVVWLGRVRELRQSLVVKGLSDASFEKDIAALEARIAAAGKINFIKRSASQLAKESAEITKALAADGDLQSRANKILADASQKAAGESKAREALNAAIASLNGVLNTPAVGTRFPAVDDAWNRAKQSLASKRDDTNPASLNALTEQAKGVLASLKKLPDAFAASPKLASSPWEQALAAVADQERDSAITAAVAAIDFQKNLTSAAIDSAAAAAGKAFTDRVAAIESLAADAKSLDGALTARAPMDQPFAGAKSTPKQLVEGIKQNAAYTGVTRIRQALSPILDRYDSLAGIAAGGTIADVAARATRAGTTPEAVLAAWQQLGTPKFAPTGDGAWLGAQADVYNALSRSGIPQAELDKARREKPVRWVAHVESLKGQDLYNALDAAERAREDFGVPAADLEKLKPHARFNMALYALQRAIGEGKGEADLRPLVDAVVALEPVVKADPNAKRMIDDFKTLGSGGPGGVVVKDLPLDKAGPASGESPFFELAAQTADTVTYRLKPATKGAGGNKYYVDSVASRAKADPLRGTDLVFRKIVPADGESKGQTVYLCTTELSVGIFIELMANRDPHSGSRFTNYPLYPATWRFTDPQARRGFFLGANSDPAVGTMWTVSNSKFNASPEKFFPDPMKGNISPPTLEHPADFIPANIVLIVAKLAGCRIPTMGEYNAALNDEGNWQDAKRWNLRDKAFAEWLEHYKSLKKANQISASLAQQPDYSAFPRDPGDIASPTDVNTTDGTPVFLPVTAAPDNQPGKFLHLIGNVAEWAYERSGEADKQTFQTVGSLISDDPDLKNFRVFGGSALQTISSDGTKLNEAKIRAGVPIPTTVRKLAREGGFSDVGMRLAFSAVAVTEESSGRTWTQDLKAKMATPAYAAPLAAK